jgi:hypothetical protein
LLPDPAVKAADGPASRPGHRPTVDRASGAKHRILEALPPEAAVNHFLREVSLGNHVVARAEESVALTKAQTFDQPHAAASSCPWLRQIKAIDLPTRAVSGDRAQVGGTLTLADCRRGRLPSISRGKATGTPSARTIPGG